MAIQIGMGFYLSGSYGEVHGDSLQLEDDAFILLEDGSRILLESA